MLSERLIHDLLLVSMGYTAGVASVFVYNTYVKTFMVKQTPPKSPLSKMIIEFVFSMVFLFIIVFQPERYSETFLVGTGFLFALVLQRDAIMEALLAWLKRK